MAKISCFLKITKAPVLASEIEAILNMPIIKSKIMAPTKIQSIFFIGQASPVFPINWLRCLNQQIPGFPRIGKTKEC